MRSTLVWASIFVVLFIAACSGSAPPSSNNDAGTLPDGGIPNVAPFFTVVTDLAIDEDAAAQALPITLISAGSADEDLVQSVSLFASFSNTNIIPAPTVTGTGATRSVNFTPLPDANGMVDLLIVATDNLGLSTSHIVHVTVRSVNDAPVVSNPGPQSTLFNAPKTIALTIGPGGGADESSQPLMVSVTANDLSLFSSLTAMQTASNAAEVVATPNTNAEGTTDVRVTVDDGQSVNHSTVVTFTVTVSQTPPDVSNVVVSSMVYTGCVPVNYVVSQGKSLTANVRLEYDVGNGFQPASIVSAGTQNVSTSPAGVSHSLTWRSDADLPDRTASGVHLRVIASRTGVSGTPGVASGVNTNNPLNIQSAVHYASGPGTIFAAVADVDHDSVLDVLTADSFSNTVSMLKGQGDGTFGGPSSYTAFPVLCDSVSPKPYFIDSADLNKDGRTDIIVASEHCPAISTLLGDATTTLGNFSAVDAGTRPEAIAHGDFNSDGNMDLVVADYSSSEVSVLLGNGTGGFSAATAYSTGINPSAVAVGDFNNDGKLDVVTANFSNNNLSLLLGHGDGTFALREDFAAGSGPQAMAVGDLNGDGIPDVVTSNPGPVNTGTSLSVILSAGTGTFTTPVNYTILPHPGGVAIGDINGDGRNDIAVVSLDDNKVSVLLGKGDGSFWPIHHFNVHTNPQNVVLGDLNKDGTLDLVTANNGTTDVSVLLNNTVSCH